MKRLVLFGIVIFLIIIGGFLIVDKVWLHKIFEIKPGSCLILEEKYCKTGKVKYMDNQPVGIVYKIDKKTALFSPITDKYLSDKITMPGENFDRNQFIVGGNVYLENDDILRFGYWIIFDGEILTEFNKKSDKKINKGKNFGYADINKTKEVILVPILNKTERITFENTETISNKTDIDQNKITELLNKINKK